MKDDEMTFKEFKKETIKFFDKIDLSKRFPTYINKWIFRFFLLLIGLVVLYDINTYGIVSYSIFCDSSEECENPYYVCGEGEYYYIDDCQREVPTTVCSHVPCDLKYIPPGSYYGRTDFLHNYGKAFLIFIFIFSFVVNHLWYKLKKRWDK